MTMGEGNVTTAEIDPEAIKVLRTIGQGNFGSVHLVEFNGTEAAAKVIHARQETYHMIEREVAIMKRVKHPNLVACFGTCQKDRCCYILQEFCAGGALFEILHNCDHFDISWQQNWQLLDDCAGGMEYLHAQSIIHRDLKSLNCLLAFPAGCSTGDFQLKVADFGMGKAKESQQDWGKMTIAAGTCHWMAPEVFTGTTYAEPADVYSYAMLMFEIICREIPFEEEEPACVGRLAVQGARPDMEAVPPDCPQALSDLMVTCWNGDPGRRPTFVEIRSSLELLRDMSALPVVSTSTAWTSQPLSTANASLGMSALPVVSTSTAWTPQPLFAANASLGMDDFSAAEDSTALPRPSLPEDLLPSPEPEAEFERISDALQVKVRCERSRVSSKRRDLLGMITVRCPETHFASPATPLPAGPLNGVALPQPSEEPEPSRAAKNRLGLDMVLVLDVSASMQGRKLETLKQAARFMVKELTSHDRLAIVTFSTRAEEHLNFCRMDETGRCRAEGILENLRVDSQTSIAAGLRLGIGLADARQSRNPVCGLLLLTDGQNNYGTIPATLVSDARERGVSTYAFGIGADHDAALLGRIADQARTPVAYIERPEALSGAFAATIGGLLSVRARNVEVHLSSIGETEIKAVHSPFLEHMTSADARLVLPDLFAGERRDVLLDVDAPSGNELLEISVRFHDEHGLTSVPNCRLQISRGEPEAEPDDEITAQRERHAVADLLKEALQEGRAGHVIKARKILEEALQRPWRPDHRSELEGSLKQLGMDVGRVNAAGFASLADVAQMHSYQRCLYSSPGLGGSNGSYLTGGQLQAIARSQ